RDGVKTNNVPSNLEWVTQGENIAHAFRTGLRAPPDFNGEKNPRARLTIQQVAEIRAAAGKESQKALAHRFGVAKSTIQWVIKGRNWRPAERPEVANG